MKCPAIVWSSEKPRDVRLCVVLPVLICKLRQLAVSADLDTQCGRQSGAVNVGPARRLYVCRYRPVHAAWGVVAQESVLSPRHETLSPGRTRKCPARQVVRESPCFVLCPPHVAKLTVHLVHQLAPGEPCGLPRTESELHVYLSGNSPASVQVRGIGVCVRGPVREAMCTVAISGPCCAYHSPESLLTRGLAARPCASTTGAVRVLS